MRFSAPLAAPYGFFSFVFLLLTAAVSAQGFYDSCAHDWTLSFGSWAGLMAVTCPDGAGRNHTSFIDLMDCVANHEGTLEGSESGTYGYSCRNCTATPPSNMTCQACYRTHGKPAPSSLDLNTVIKNVNGIIGCYSYLGVEVKSMDTPPA